MTSIVLMLWKSNLWPLECKAGSGTPLCLMVHKR